MDTSLFSNLLFVGVNFIIAVLIGSTAIGGLLLVPGLNVVGDVPVHVAIPSCMFALIFTGIVGALIFGRSGSIVLSDFLMLALGAGASAFVGSFALTHIPSTAVQITIAGLCIASGIHTLGVGRQQTSRSQGRNGGMLIVIGLVTGFGSAITGTGGPLILMPIMLALKMDLRQAIGLAQAIQIPIGILATSGNLMMGRVDFDIALPITVILVIGAAIGAILAQRFSMAMLRVSVAGLLVISGVAYMVKIV